MTTTYLTHVSRLGLFAILSYASIGAAAAACKPPKSDYKNVSCTAQSGVFLATKDDGSPVALLDNKGKKTADLFAYHAVLAHQFGDGLMPVQLGGKVGYINKNGKTAISIQYDRMPTGAWARGVSDGRIVVYKNGAFGVIDTKGRTVVSFDRSISNITDFQNGVATVSKGSQRYQIDASGKRIAVTAPQTTAQSSSPPPPPSYTQTMPPPASVTISQTSSNVLGASIVQAQPTNTTPTALQTSVSTSVVSTPMVATSSTTPISQGAVVSAMPIRSSTASPPFFPAEQNGKWGFIDANGVAMIQYVFDEVQNYSEGLAAVRMGSRWGYIDGRGDLVIDFRFANSGIVSSNTPATPSTPLTFQNGRAWIGNLQDGTKMCINRQGNPIACQE